MRKINKRKRTPNRRKSVKRYANGGHPSTVGSSRRRVRTRKMNHNPSAGINSVMDQTLIDFCIAFGFVDYKERSRNFNY